MLDRSRPDVATSTLDRVGRIDRARVYLVHLPVRSPRRHGSGDVMNAVRNVILRLDTDTGLSGWGEAAPWPVFTGTAEASAAALHTHLAPIMLGKPATSIARIMADADQVLVGHPEAKAALETALFDICGKAAGLPVAELLGGRVRDRIPLSFSVANPDFAADLDLVAELYGQGVRLFKLKTGFAGHKFDLMRIERLGADFPDAELRADYNQGLEPHQAPRRLADLDGLGLGFIEQPVPRAAARAMADLTRRCATPIVADESVFSPAEALLAVRDGVADLISVKIMKSGGLRQAQSVANIAEAAGMACYGGDMFETGIAHLAGTHLIAATPNISLGCEFYQANWYLQRDLLAARFPVENGCVVVPDAPGLGIDVDPEALKAQTIDMVEARSP